MTQREKSIGLGGMSLYVPPYRVSLEDWCGWNNLPWTKIASVVGRSFRQIGPQQSIYTLAANAALRLIQKYDLDPQEIGMLALGTESSTDNAAGAVIVRGMLDSALRAHGLAPIARDCEVPEFKHACLGGVYGIKAAWRYLRSDGRGRKAIVIAADVAEYERGSTGEQTQGAGAVAMLLEEDPRLCALELNLSGSSSAYRGLDFRKPVARHSFSHYTPNVERMHDFPVFNGKYSTYCYLDAVWSAFANLSEKTGEPVHDLLQDAGAVLFHRPYHWMPIQALATVWTRSLQAGNPELFAQFCQEAEVAVPEVERELSNEADLFGYVQERGVGADPTPLLSAVTKVARSAPAFTTFQKEKMSLGADKMMDIGNIYTGALPAWLAAAFEDAAEQKANLDDQRILAVGYGSGDAAEALVLRPSPGWQKAAAKIGFGESLLPAVDLTKQQYEALHDGREPTGLEAPLHDQFVVTHLGQQVSPEFQDVGIEYYQYVRSTSAVRATA